MIIDASHGSPLIKPAMWAIDPGIVAYNASRMGLPMFKAAYVWGSGNQWPNLRGDGNNGTIIGPLWVGGDLKWTATSGERVEIPHIAISPNLTFITQITLDSVTGVHNLGSKWNSLTASRSWMLDANSNKLRGLVSTDGSYQAGYTVNGGTILEIGKTYIAALVIDGRNTDTILYLDGRQDGIDSTGPASIYIGGSQKINLGRSGDGSAVLDGIISWALLYDLVLIPSQIATISADPYGLVRQPSMEELWAHVAVVGAVAPTGVFYGPLFGPLGGPV